MRFMNFLHSFDTTRLLLLLLLIGQVWQLFVLMYYFNRKDRQDLKEARREHTRAIEDLQESVDRLTDHLDKMIIK